MDTDSLLPQIMEHVDMFDLAADYGIYDGERGEVFVCCPIHQEDTPSARFYTDGLIYCFGCQTMITPINFIMHMEDLTFNSALHWLENKYNFKIDREYSVVKVPVEQWYDRILAYRYKLPLDKYKTLWRLYDQEVLTERMFNSLTKD